MDASDKLEEEKPIPSEVELEDFKYQVSEWLKLDDKIRLLKDAIKERRTIQGAYAKSVQEFMRKYGYDNLNTQHGIIKASTKQRKIPVKLSDVKAQLFSLEDEVMPIRDVISRIFESERPVKTCTSLRRVVPKVSTLDL